MPNFFWIVYLVNIIYHIFNQFVTVVLLYTVLFCKHLFVLIRLFCYPFLVSPLHSLTVLRFLLCTWQRFRSCVKMILRYKSNGHKCFPCPVLFIVYFCLVIFFYYTWVYFRKFFCLSVSYFSQFDTAGCLLAKTVVFLLFL